MKNFLLILLFVTGIRAIGQNKDYLLSLDGIGPLKLNMTVIELENLLQKKIVFKVIGIDSVVLTETIKTKYKGIDVEIDLVKLHGEPYVYGIQANSSLVRTKDGIGLGSTKLQIINAYENYYVDAGPEFTERGEKLIKSKTKSTVLVKEASEGNAILFSLVNNKVVSFRIFPHYDDEE